MSEEILKLLGGALGASRPSIESDHLTSLGSIDLKGRSVPVYLVCELGNTKVLDDLEIRLRQKHKLSPGIVLSVSESVPRYLGPNVVMKLSGVLSSGDDTVTIDMEEIQRQFDTRRSLVTASQVAQVIRHSAHSGTLILPGVDPLNLTSANQLNFFERLVTAATDGSREVLTKALMEGMGADHPKNLFSPKLRDIVVGQYICHGSSNRYWRLVSGGNDLIAGMQG